MEESLLDLRLEQMEKEEVLQQNLRTSVEQVTNAINSWKLSYCLYAPIAGKVSFTTYWNENQYIPSGDTVCTIVPESRSRLMGKAQLPVERSGKVKVGQRVIIRFSNYPDEEFGTVEGRVASVSLVPAENNYMVEIDSPNGLQTNYGYTLPVLQEMPATAEIVTDDLRLIERAPYRTLHPTGKENLERGNEPIRKFYRYGIGRDVVRVTGKGIRHTGKEN